MVVMLESSRSMSHNVYVLGACVQRVDAAMMHVGHAASILESRVSVFHTFGFATPATLTRSPFECIWIICIP
jgi:hypothetical protein